MQIATGARLLTKLAQQRAVRQWLAKATAAWQALGRLYVQAFAAELDGRGEPRRMMRLQLAMARVRFYMQRCQQVLAGR